MDDKALLELCVGISGAFENGTPSYQAVTGNFDGQGLSVGVLQWAAGQGSLSTLLFKIAEKMGWDKMQTFFKSDIHHFAVLKPKEAIQWCLDHYIADGSTNVDPAAKACWVNLLSQPEAIAAQVELAETTVLSRAKLIAAKFCPDYPDSTRVIAFFFDLVTQSGGMENQRGHVDPLPPGSDPDVQDVLDFAHTHNLKCAGIWEVAVQGDQKARLLLYYAYKRSQLSKPEYVWDACSRRGSIACRGGFVHGGTVSFGDKLD